MLRKEERETVLGLIFETEFKTNCSPEDIFAISSEVREIPQSDYIHNIYFGVCEHKEEINALISQFSNGWKINRLSKMTISILRLCIYELKYMKDIPANVSINEAIELCKKYDDDKARPFINGILNSIKNDLEPQK